MTITDVAEAAQVSRSTVSRVLTGDYPVSADKRRRVQDAIEQLGYRRCAAARALVQGRSRLIAVVIGPPQQIGWGETLSAIDSCASADDCTIALAIVKRGDPAAVRRAVDRVLEQGVDAVLVIAHERWVAAAARYIPPAMPAALLMTDTTAGSQVLVVPAHGAGTDAYSGSDFEGSARLAYDIMRRPVDMPTSAPTASIEGGKNRTSACCVTSRRDRDHVGPTSAS